MNELQVQDYSSSSVSRIEKITSQNVSQLNFSSITGYMVVEYDEHWWIVVCWRAIQKKEK